MTSLPDYISRACEIQAQVGESRQKFAEIFSEIYSETVNQEIGRAHV